MLKGTTVLLGVSGSIAAYKIASLARALKKLDADIVWSMYRWRKRQMLSCSHLQVRM